MAGNKSFQDYVLEQLTRTGIKAAGRPMFGGVGLYSGPLFFGIISRHDVLYFKVDDSNRPDFEAREMGPFKPFGEDGETMGYYEVPADVLDDAEALAIWTEKAVQVARTRKAVARAKGGDKGKTSRGR